MADFEAMVTSIGTWTVTHVPSKIVVANGLTHPMALEVLTALEPFEAKSRNVPDSRLQTWHREVVKAKARVMAHNLANLIQDTSPDKPVA